MINQEEYEILKKCDDEFKWVARDKNRKLWAYTKKPDKGVHSWGRVVNVDFLPRHSKDLFQFIQWEDEEPYRISDLIKEYEIKELRLAPSGTVIVDSFSESEETEVKKNKEWAQKEVDRYLSYEGVNEARNALVFAKRVIDQLDEPEVPVVPEKVYEYITQQKRDRYTIQQVFYQVHWNYKNESMAEEEEWVSGNEEEFARAWLAYPNIEVEKEPKYYVMKDGVVILSKRYRDYESHESHWIGTVTNKEYIKENPDKVRFTEQEIKDYDERFWAFAVPVVEVSND